MNSAVNPLREALLAMTVEQIRSEPVCSYLPLSKTQLSCMERDRLINMICNQYKGCYNHPHVARIMSEYDDGGPRPMEIDG